MSSTDAFFNSGGSGYPPFKFEHIGDAIAGTITRVSDPIEGTDLNGNPQTSIAIEIHTDDGADWTLWVQKPRMIVAIADAVRAAGGAGTPQVGGRLGVRHHAEKPSTKPGFNAQKLYEAQYQPPASAASSDFFARTDAAPAPPAAEALI